MSQTVPICRRLTGAVAMLAVLGLASPASFSQEDASEDPETSPAQASNVPDVAGVWGQKMVMTALSDPPVVGKVTNETVTFQRVEIRQDGRKLTIETEPCDVDISSDFDGIRTILPDGFVDALPETTRKGRLLNEGNRWLLEAEKSVSVVGARLREPGSEYLPDDSDDDRVVDSDDDGNPGVTVRIEGMVNGKLYVVQRGWDRYWGPLVTDELIKGRVQWETDQKVLGSTSVFLGDQPPTEPHPDADRSNFEMVRMSDDASCKDVLEQID